MKDNTINLIAVGLFATVLTLSIYAAPVFAQSEETNQTLKEGGEAVNQTGEAIQGNASELGANITEGATNVVENIGEGLVNLTK